MQNYEIIHKYNNYHNIVKCTIGDFLMSPVQNWKHNRPPDPNRCREIADTICRRRQCVDWMFYASVLDNGTICILDGIHRYTALKIIANEQQQQTNSWLLDQYIFLSLRYKMSAGEEIDLFQQINNSNPVPSLYYNNTSETKKRIIQDVLTVWMTRYKSHFSNSTRPQIPNTNRDQFTEMLDDLYEKHQICESNKEDLTLVLEDLNAYMRDNVPKKTSISALAKCRETGCYLFLKK